jgi:hypothetical protein
MIVLLSDPFAQFWESLVEGFKWGVVVFCGLVFLGLVIGLVRAVVAIVKFFKRRSDSKSNK